ncbi:MAG: 3',5'-cyclic-AMP phosphodiesterase [Moraxellaceae bacterium]|nr:MAG: 3',5'-cyclic-AMP phosphodiesterase [Moraxellaceae bacterium]
MNESKPHKNSINILQVTDSHLFASQQGKLLGLNTDQSLQRVIELIRGEDADFVFATGDISQDGSLQSYLRFNELISDLRIPTYWLEGNHDQFTAFQSELGDSSRMSPCSMSLGQWGFILLNSSVDDEVPGYLADSELKFLEATLLEFKDKHVLIALHHHVIETGCEWLDEQIVGNAEQFFELIDRHSNVRGVIWGHVHQDIEIQRKGVKLMSSPSTCVQFKANSKDFCVDSLAPGYRRIECHDNGSIETEVHRAEGFEFEVDYSIKGY